MSSVTISMMQHDKTGRGKMENKKSLSRNSKPALLVVEQHFRSSISEGGLHALTSVRGAAHDMC